MIRLFASANIVLVLLLTLTLPSFAVLILFATSNALGLLIVLGMNISLFLISRAFDRYPKPVGRSIFIVIIIIGLVLIHGTISFFIHDDFDFGRFFQTYLYLIMFLAGCFSLSLLLYYIPDLQWDVAVRRVFYVLLLSAFAAILGFSPFPSGQNKPVFFYNEASHFALDFLPLLLYVVVKSSNRRKQLVLTLGYLIGFLLENLSLLVGCTLIFAIAIPFRRSLVPVFMICIAALYGVSNMDYYSARLDLTGNNQSTLILLSGWERAYLSFKDTYGLGVGFQQFGIIGSHGTIMDVVNDIAGVDDLNLRDGGAVAPKIIGEFGIFGLALLGAYFMYFFRSFSWLRQIALGKIASQKGSNVFFVSWYLMFVIDFFVRGAGYFYSTGYMFVSAVFWLFAFGNIDCLRSIRR